MQNMVQICTADSRFHFKLKILKWSLISRVLLSSKLCDRGTTQPVGSCLCPVSTVSVIAAISPGGRGSGRGTGAGGGARPACN